MIKMLVVGVGSMGFSHVKAYGAIGDFEIVGLVARDFSKWPDVPPKFPDVPLYSDFYQALDFCKPDAVSINSYTDTHADFSIAAMEAGAHVFVEKPLALNTSDATRVIDTARRTDRKMLVGYILRHHPVWMKFIDVCRSLGRPMALNMTSNQYSVGDDWITHKRILSAGLSPLVDCGIHYADVMLQIMKESPVSIAADGKKTTDDVMVENDTNMTINFEDGSSLYFESAFGPSVEKNFVNYRRAKSENGTAEITENNVVMHNATEYYFSEEEQDSAVIKQAEYFQKCINDDLNLEDHWNDAILSLEIVLNAEKVMKNN